MQVWPMHECPVLAGIIHRFLADGGGQSRGPSQRGQQQSLGKRSLKFLHSWNFLKSWVCRSYRRAQLLGVNSRIMQFGVYCIRDVSGKVAGVGAPNQVALLDLYVATAGKGGRLGTVGGGD